MAEPRNVGLERIFGALALALGLTGIVMIGANLWNVDLAAAGKVRFGLWDWASAWAGILIGLADLVGAYLAYVWLRGTVVVPLGKVNAMLGQLRQASALRIQYRGPVRQLAELSGNLNRIAADFEASDAAREQGERRARLAYSTLVKALEDTVALNREVSGLNLELGGKTAALEEALSRLQLAYDELKEMKEVDRLKANFLNAISHELRTPLNFITGFASLLEDEVQGSLNETQRRSIRKVLEGADQLIGLIDDLLDYARMEAGQFALDLRPTVLEPIVREVVESMTPLARDKGLALAVREIADAPLLADPGRVRQVLYNLVSNAIKFTPEGGQVTIGIRDAGDHVVLEVSDTGRGIGPADLPRVFSKFFQARVAETGSGNQVKGTGLGLAITKGLVEAHGGRMEVESEEGRGSTFRAIFPARTGPSSASPTSDPSGSSCNP